MGGRFRGRELSGRWRMLVYLLMVGGRCGNGAVPRHPAGAEPGVSRHEMAVAIARRRDAKLRDLSVLRLARARPKDVVVIVVGVAIGHDLCGRGRHHFWISGSEKSADA